MYCLLHLLQDKESLWLVEEDESVDKLKKHPYFTCLSPTDEWFFVKSDFSLNLYKYGTYVQCNVTEEDGKAKLHYKLVKALVKDCPRLFEKKLLDTFTLVH